MYRLFPKGQLAILPGAHGEYIGEKSTHTAHNPLPGVAVTLIEKFLDE